MNKRKGSSTKNAPPKIGFKYKAQIPSPEACALSIGRFDDDIVPSEYVPNGNFEPLREPTHEDDWLAQHKPDNQTFQAWHKQLLSYKRDVLSKKIIYFLPIGQKGHVETLPSLPLLVEFSFFLGFEVKLLDPLFIEITYSEATIKASSEGRRGKRSRIYDLDWRHSHPYDEHKMKEEHMQYSVHPLLRLCGTVAPPDARCIVGVTMEDLYSDSTDSFTVGMASGPLAGVAIFSFARYDPLFDVKHTNLVAPAKPKRSSKKRKVTKEEEEAKEEDEEWKGESEANTKLLLERSCKVLAHEIGHILGVEHCTYYNCLMNGSGHLLEDFMQPLHLCPVDLRKIITALGGCDVVERYKALLMFYTKVEFTEEYKWLKGRIDFLENSKNAHNTKNTKKAKKKE